MENKIHKTVKDSENLLEYLGYSERTIEIYCHYISKFLEKINKHPQHLTSFDFQEYLFNYEFSSKSQQNQIINSIKFLYEKVLNKKYGKVKFFRPKKEKHLPKIIERDFLLLQISKIENLKHKAIISLAYSVGLRVSEVCNLKIEDIDSNRMLINIRQAKGRKDRIVPLSPGILNLLREYYKEFKPNQYLFNGQNKLQYSSGSCNQIVKKYLGEEFHFHLLRHSSATTMLESGVDLRYIQSILGHNNIKTTTIYTHISSSHLNKILLPI